MLLQIQSKKAIDGEVPSICIVTNDKIDISPVFGHDMVVNTGVLTSGQAACDIAKQLKNGFECTAMQQNHEHFANQNNQII